MEVNTLVQIYAVDFLLKEDVEWVAAHIYDIMENSITHDSLPVQESTRDFLTKVIEVMNQHNKRYTEEITKTYLELTLNLMKKGTGQ